MDSDRVERRLAALLSADAVGYSRRMADDEVATVRALSACRDEMAASIALHQGRLVDAPGDNLLAEFRSALESTQCAIEIQRSLLARNAELEPKRQLEFRIGLHLMLWH